MTIIVFSYHSFHCLNLDTQQHIFPTLAPNDARYPFFTPKHHFSLCASDSRHRETKQHIFLTFAPYDARSGSVTLFYAETSFFVILLQFHTRRYITRCRTYSCSISAPVTPATAPLPFFYAETSFFVILLQFHTRRYATPPSCCSPNALISISTLEQ